MFTSSLRRALFSVPSSSITATFTASAPKAAASQYRSQRRYSSSKPSSPANGAKGVSDGQPAPTQHSRSSRQKAKDVVDDCTVKARDKTVQKLPSVPSTMHLKSEDVTASDFFSLHRPISVTEVWPKTISDEMFGNIFTKRARKTDPTAVIGTISNTIDGLDVAMQDTLVFSDDLPNGFAFGNHSQGETKHLDQQPSTVSLPFPRHILKPNFMPFSPPPPPIPMSDEQAVTVGLEASEDLSKPAHSKTYHALITVEESKDENGEVQYTSYASGFIPAPEEPAPPSFLERMRIRQRRYEDSLDRKSEDNSMLAISVKRQRKLKMKKHKYKKLMRRTRNLRRRLDRN